MTRSWTPPLTLNQQKALAIIPKITASMSILGSGFIMQHVIRSRKRRRLCYHRLLLGMSVMDSITSFRVSSIMIYWTPPVLFATKLCISYDIEFFPLQQISKQEFHVNMGIARGNRSLRRRRHSTNMHSRRILRPDHDSQRTLQRFPCPLLPINSQIFMEGRCIRCIWGWKVL